MTEITLHSPAEIVAAWLVQTGLGAAPVEEGVQSSWPVYRESEPAVPDNVLTVYDYGAEDHGRTGPDSERQVHHLVQVRARSTTHTVGFQKLRAIALAMDAEYQTVVPLSGTNYLIHSFNRTTEVTPIGPDPESHRRLFTLNVALVIHSL